MIDEHKKRENIEEEEEMLKRSLILINMVNAEWW